MIIDEKGYELSSLDDILDAYEKQLQSKFGADFYIKPEGVIDNIAASAGFMEMSLQEQIAFLSKQFDPETAEGNWQDALYERIGVKRLEAAPTIFIKKIKGSNGFNGAARSITIRSETTKDEFENINSYTINDSGFIETEFQSVLTGAIMVNPEEKFVIVTAPDEITAITEDYAENISIGRERETDNEFRIRFRESKALNAKATRNANEANLIKYVDNISLLKIIDKKTDNSIKAGELLIIAKHNTTDEIFANAIFESVADGIELLGDTQISVKDISNQNVNINFKNANEINIDLKAVLKIRNGYYANTVFTNVKKNILNYIDKRCFGLESIIYATEFIIPILEVEGVEAVLDIKVKKSADESYIENIALTREEVPKFSKERILLNENS